jgi:hypothetical protein
MTEADAKHRFTFIPSDISVNSLAVFVTHFSAKVCGVDRWLLTGCELVPYPSVIAAHDLLMMPSDSQE